MRLIANILILLSLSVNVLAAEEFSFIETDSTEYSFAEQFIIPTIPQRYIDETNDTLIVVLEEADYVAVAKELNVEVAAIKAVVDVETGRQHVGFCAPHVPIIYFDAKVFRRNCARKGIGLSTHGKIQSGHGVNQTLAHDRLSKACAIDSVTAFESTFWGMFQIGGFNWKLCGCRDVGEFVGQMKYSEPAQLELFARFLVNTGLVEYLRNKNWRAFAYRYNGPKYAQRGYHTRLARAYKKHLTQ